MICPVCKEDMLVIEYNEVEVDFCSTCQGIWFDTGELEMLFISAGLMEEDADLSKVLTPPGQVKEKPRKCSLCRKRMEKKILGSHPGVLIDRCVNGDGLWFDGGELRQALHGFAGGDSEAVNDILSFLGETLPDNNEEGGSQ